MKKTLVLQKLLWTFFLWMSEAVEAFETCSDQFQTLDQSCTCTNSREGYDVWCPNSENPKVRFHVKPQVLFVSCHDIDHDELRSLLTNFSLGSSTAIVEFKQCQITSYNDYLLKMTGIEELRITSGYYSKNANITSPFEELGKLKRLRIVNTNFNNFRLSKLFNGLTNLEILHLTNNRGFDSFPDFDSLSKLLSLEIDQRSIKTLPPNLLRGLTDLKQIKLRLGVTPMPDLFENNANIVSAEISDLDAIKLQNESLFTHMTKLNNVTISGVGFNHLSVNLFQTNDKVKFFEWRHDRCPNSGCSNAVQPASFVKNLSSLLIFQIVKSFTPGVVLNNDFFWGCLKLRQVKINRARLKVIPAELFRDTKELEEVDLSYNHIMDIPDRLFHAALRLRSLTLKRNRLTVML